MADHFVHVGRQLLCDGAPTFRTGRFGIVPGEFDPHAFRCGAFVRVGDVGK